MAVKKGDGSLRNLMHFGWFALTSLASAFAFAQATAEPAAAPSPAAAVATLPPVSSAILPAPAPAPVPAAAAKAPALKTPVATKPASADLPARPLWQELTAAQKVTLAPLAGEWDKLEGGRKKKWLEISAKFSTMKPDEQQRVQERMREWLKLTPDQRRVARESFARTKALDPEQKSAQWQQYQQLPDDQKKKLAADASAKTPVARLPSDLNKSKPLPPIKATPKPVLEQSITPQATNQSNIGPSPLPENK